MLQGKILRVARPTDRLEQVVHFYTEGLGLQILDHFENHEGFDGVMVGIPGESYHLNLPIKGNTMLVLRQLKII